jgi:hypothetical protein
LQLQVAAAAAVSRRVTHQMIPIREKPEQNARQHLSIAVDDALDRDGQSRRDGSKVMEMSIARRQ